VPFWLSPVGDDGSVNERDLELRNLTYSLFVERGRAPTADEVAPWADATRDDVEAAWRRLHDAHALVLNLATTELWMASPFSAVPTAYRVEASGRSWYANCAWDAFGVCAALHVDGHIETSCSDCGEPIAVEIRRKRPDDESLVFHCLVPAARWWDDIVFT
jgi:Alkylmercury lyase